MKQSFFSSRILNWRNILTLVLLTSLSSCFYSTRYLASYKLRNNQPKEDTSAELRRFVELLAHQHNLSRDSDYSNSDTLAFYGDPYHYFKFSVHSDSLISSLQLDYRGTFGNRRNPPYDMLLNQLSDSVSTNFQLIDKEIVETGNRRSKQRKKAGNKR